MKYPSVITPTKVSVALLSLYTFSIGLEELITIPLAGNKVQIPEIIFLFYALSIFINFKEIRLNTRDFNKLDISIFTYFLAVGLSFTTNQTRNSFGELLGITYFMSLFFLTKGLILSNYHLYPKIQEYVLKAAVLGAIVAISFGLLGYALFYINGSVHYIWYYKDYPIIGDAIRIKGTVSNPITLCGYLVSLTILLLPNKSFNSKTKIGIIAFLILGVLATKTKSLILLFSIALVYLTRYQGHILARLSAQGIAVLAIGFYLITSHFLVSSANNTALLQNKGFGSNSIAYKNDQFLISPTAYTVLKQSALLAFQSSPIVGIGGNELIKYSSTLFAQNKLTIDPNCAPHSTFYF
jgi:hypothetical protein